MNKASEKAAVIPVKSNKPSSSYTPRNFLTPFEDMERWAEEFFPGNWLRSHLHDWPARSLFTLPIDSRMPNVDVIDRDEEIVIKAELPGVNKDDIDVSLSDNMITIKASSKKEKKEEKGDYYRSEISEGSYSRSMSLPAAVDIEKAQAELVDGILELKLPKIEGAKRRNIKVK